MESKKRARGDIEEHATNEETAESKDLQTPPPSAKRAKPNPSYSYTIISSPEEDLRCSTYLVQHDDDEKVSQFISWLKKLDIEDQSTFGSLLFNFAEKTQGRFNLQEATSFLNGLFEDADLYSYSKKEIKTKMAHV